ncbi:MAG: Flagellar Assembly Protein [Firmicutes bacterium]|nr:Flagellar Assembly Protein [Bacillota bacterium]
MADDTTMMDHKNDTISKEGTYVIALSDLGVYLMVNPPSGNGVPVKDSIVIADLQSRGVKDFQASMIIKIIREALGVPTKIAEAPSLPAEPDIRVLVSRDRMEASLSIFFPQNCRPVSSEEIFAKLQNSGVIYNLDKDAIEKALRNPGITTVCAKGKPPVAGDDARIKYYIDFEMKGKPVEAEDGRVDYKKLNLYTQVQQGELIAEKIPFTSGVEGIDVLGQIVPAKSGKDIPFPLGKNVILENNNQIAAGLAGQVILKRNKIHVIPMIEVNGDVDLSTGNIEFNGNVIIHGSVQPGFSIKAEGDVEIQGTVSGAVVEGNNVTIRMGIQGMQQGYIKAAINLTTHFIENAMVSAGQDIFVRDVILNSHISAGRKIEVIERRGAIIGGEVSAGEEIHAKTVGTPSALSTNLQVGVNPLLREEYTHLRKNLKNHKSNLDQTQKALSILKTLDQSELPPEKRELLLKLTKTHFYLIGQIDSIQNRINEIENSFDEMRHGKIRVSDIVYPGVKIVVGTLVKPIRETMKFVVFYVGDGEIVSGSYR